MEYQKGRRLFDKDSHAKYDTLGKNFGYDLINHYLANYPHLEIISSKYIEDKKCGVSLQFNDKTERFNIVFEFIENYVFVCAFSSIPI